jgi:hypothetical protein
MGEMRRAIARENPERSKQERFASTLVIAWTGHRQTIAPCGVRDWRQHYPCPDHPGPHCFPS